MGSSSEVIANRAALGFREAVLREFVFLIRDYGFRIVREEATLVKFESDVVFVNVYHGRQSYEVKFEIGLISGEDEPSMYYPSDIAALSGSSEQLFLQASSPEGVGVAVARLGTVLGEAGHDLLTGNPFTFKRLEEIQERKSATWISEWELKSAREEVATAWQKRDFRRIVDLFGPLREKLTPAERKKLQYAQKQIL